MEKTMNSKKKKRKKTKITGNNYIINTTNKRQFFSTCVSFMRFPAGKTIPE